MRLKSEGRSNLRVPLLVFAAVALAVDFLLYYLRGSLEGQWLFSYLTLFILAYVLYRGPANFFYDTEGEVMNLTNSDALFGKIIPSYSRHYEFPKYKFLSFKIHSWPGRRWMTIQIKSKSGKVKSRTLFISYLKGDQYKSLKQSLTKYASLNKNVGRKSSTAQS